MFLWIEQKQFFFYSIWNKLCKVHEHFSSRGMRIKLNESFKIDEDIRGCCFWLNHIDSGGRLSQSAAWEIFGKAFCCSYLFSDNKLYQTGLMINIPFHCHSQLLSTNSIWFFPTFLTTITIQRGQSEGLSSQILCWWKMQQTRHARTNLIQNT